MTNSAALLGRTGRYGDLKKRLLFLIGALVAFCMKTHYRRCYLVPYAVLEVHRRESSSANESLLVADPVAPLAGRL